MMSVPLCYYGSPEPLPVRRVLRAGPLTAVYEAGDLRYVRAGGVEVCRRWYAAVRDHNWGTVPGVISDEVIEQTADGFRVRYTSTHRRGDIHFVWHAEIVGTADGVRFTFDSEAKTTFRRNRIGFCVLHPPDTCKGRSAELSHPDGRTGYAIFPDFIAPQNPFRELAGLRHDLPGGGSAAWQFDGDIFETEDQRNWIDASFKTFCTPLWLPFPVEVKAGERVRQVVTLRVTGVPKAAAETAAATLRPVDGDRQQLPWIGLSAAGHGEPLTDREAAVLRALHPQYLLADVRPGEPGWRERWRRDLADAEALGVNVEPAVYLAAGQTPSPDDADLLAARSVRSARVHQADGWAAPAELIALARKVIHGREVIAGTQANFTELNRNRPPVESLDGVCYSVQPQEHAFDNASLVECCAAIADTVRSAKAFCGGKPIHVGPITLRKRVNPYATGPAPPVPPCELPPTVDPRQTSLFGAGWTLAALKYLAESGVQTATFYETTGWLGVMEREAGCPLPDGFPSRPGMVFPLYHVLADATEVGCDGRTVRPCRSSDPLAFDGLRLDGDAGPAVLLANLTAEPLTLAVHDLPPAVRVRVLDETTFDRATADPLGWRADRGTEHATVDGALSLSLRPYAYVRIDGL
jgi:hypothetical protein